MPHIFQCLLQGIVLQNAAIIIVQRLCENPDFHIVIFSLYNGNMIDTYNPKYLVASCLFIFLAKYIIETLKVSVRVIKNS